MISAQNLRISRGEQTIIDEVSLACGAGQVHAIVGANGSGKSTLLSALAGDLPVDSGQILIDGREITSLSDSDQAISRAVLSQYFPLFPFTVDQLLTLAVQQRERHGSSVPAAAIDVSELSHRRFTTLSGGERARVMLAMTLAQGAKTLLLDEPTAAFDRQHRDRFVDWLAQWQGAGYSIVIVTHDDKIEALATSMTEL